MFHNVNVNAAIISPLNDNYIVFNATRVSRKSSAKAGKVTYVNYTLSHQRLEFQVHVTIFLYFYLGLLTTGVARSGQRQVPFLKPHLVTVTDTRPTSRKYVVNVFPKDITSWSGQDSNPGPSAPDPDALTTRPQRHSLLLIFWFRRGEKKLLSLVIFVSTDCYTIQQFLY